MATRHSERRFADCGASDTRAGLSYFAYTEPKFIARTARLAIRELVPDDTTAMLELCSDAELMRYVGDGSPLKRADVERWIRVSQENYVRRGYGCFAVEITADKSFAGYCGLVNAPGCAEIELIYALRREFHGRGMATEAARAMLHYGFETFALPEIIATLDPANLASQRVVAKLGLLYDCERLDDYGIVEAVYRLSRADWLKGASA